MNVKNQTVMDSALKHLGKQAYSRLKLGEKLRRSGFEENEVEECLNRLIDWGYLDDRDYGIYCIELLQSRLKSKNYTKLYLIEYGLDESLAEELLEKYYPLSLEVVIAQKVLAKRNFFKDNPKAKEWIYLTRAGFHEDTVRQCFPDVSPT